MAPKKTLDEIEKEVDQIEEDLDQLIGPEETFTKKEVYALLLVVSQIALWSGAAISHILTKRILKTKYDQIIEQEVAELKAYYNRETKKAMMDVAVDGGGPEGPFEDDSFVNAKYEEAIKPYQGEQESNVFSQRRSEANWDAESELALRETLEPGVPYVISQQEYFENEHDYQQQTLTYFEGDAVLLDAQEKPIDEVDMVVGESNLERFGQGSTDRNIVHIRNTKIPMDFEVIRSEGKYTEEVLGFKHSDEPNVRRMRRDRE